MKKIILTALVAFLGVGISAEQVELKTAYEDVAPKFMKDAKGNFSGLIPELLDAITKDTGITFTAPKDFIPKQRYQDGLTAGTMDVMFGLKKDKDREKLFTFGEPLYSVEYILVANKTDLDPVKNVEDLKKLAADKGVLTVFQAASVGFLTKLGLKVDDGGKTVGANLEKLVRNRGRYFVYQNLSTLYELNNSPFKDQVKVLPIDLETYSHYVVFSKSLSASTVKKINDSIINLKKTGVWGKILAKYL